MVRRLMRLTALLAAAMLALTVPRLVTLRPDAALPGAKEAERTLLRIWVTGAPGGGMKWLQGRLSAFEKAHPGVSCYVRQVTPDMLTAEASPLPEVILFMPGDVTAPEELLIPLTGTLNGEDALLRAGRWQGRQYAAPLCWSGWVLAVDSRYDDVPQSTPVPTTLLGRPASTPDALPAVTPAFPADKATTLLAPHGGGLFSLRGLLSSAAVAPQAESLTPQQVWEAFLAQKSAAALLTTGQAAAMRSLQSAGRGFPCRILTPEEIITDQVWMAGLTGTSPMAAALISHLSGEASQRALTGQSLHGIDLSRPLYGDGVPALVESAARRSLAAVNAFLPREAVARVAWQAFRGEEDALAPLL